MLQSKITAFLTPISMINVKSNHKTFSYKHVHGWKVTPFQPIYAITPLRPHALMTKSRILLPWTKTFRAFLTCVILYQSGVSSGQRNAFPSLPFPSSSPVRRPISRSAFTLFLNIVPWESVKFQSFTICYNTKHRWNTCLGLTCRTIPIRTDHDRCFWCQYPSFFRQNKTLISWH